MPRVLLISAVLALSACGGGGSPSPSPAPAPAPAPSPLPTPSPAPAPSPIPGPTPSPSPGSSVCGSAFLGAATAQFSSDSCVRDAVCATDGPANAIDNNRDTAAEVIYTGVPGSVTLVARAQPGTVVRAGQQAGALISLNSQAAVSASLSFRTYLNDTLQETAVAMSGVLSPTTNTTPSFQGFANTKPYDRIDVVVEQSGSVITRIFEVCSE